MSIFSKLSSAEEKRLAGEMAAQLVKNMSPKLMTERRHTLSASRITRLLEQVLEKARRHNEVARLGFLKRSIFANSFKWELQSSGYPSDFVNLAVEGLIVELSKKPSK